MVWKGVTRDRNSLWMLVVSPAVWAAHFLLCYVSAAVWCGKFAGADDGLGIVRTAIGGYTAAALVVIGIMAWLGYRQHRAGGEKLPHDDDTPEDRRRFVGYATLLLSGLSGVAVIYAALAAVFIGTCQ